MRPSQPPIKADAASPRAQGEGGETGLPRPRFPHSGGDGGPVADTASAPRRSRPWWAWALLGCAAAGGANNARAQENESLWKRGGLRVFEMLPLEDIQNYRKSLHEWEGIVRGFRREHNFTLTGGMGQGLWRFNKLEAKGANHEESRSLYYRFQYQYHLPLAGGFGYTLGTSLISQPYENFKNKKTMSLERSFSVPGLNVGLVYDVSPGLRFLLGLDGHLHRIEHLVYKGDGGDHRKVTVTARVWGVHAAADIFYRLSWALRLEAEYRRFSYIPPKNAESYGVDFDMAKEEKLFGLGFVYHLI